MQNSNKRVALVTGANRGIGFEIAQQLARQAMTVLVGACDEERGTEARNRIADQGLDAHFIRASTASGQCVRA